MVGRSAPIFRGVVELCAVRLRDSEAPYLGVKEAAYCSLRSQLLMALHDGGANEITSKVPGLQGAWAPNLVRPVAGASSLPCAPPLQLTTLGPAWTRPLSLQLCVSCSIFLGHYLAQP